MVIRVYIGDWVNDIKEGKGKLISKNKEYYEGDWKNDLREGDGIFRWPNGQEFKGKYVNDTKEGPGSIFWASNGQRLVANFVNGQIEGTATRYYSNGDIYEQTYKEGKKIDEKKISGGSGEDKKTAKSGATNQGKIKKKKK